MIEDWTFEEIFKAFERLYTPGTKTGIFYHKDMYNYFIREPLNRTTPPKQLPERYMLEKVATFFLPHDLFFETFDKKIQQMFEAGIIALCLKYHEDTFKPNKFQSQQESFKVLTLTELKAGFVISLVPLVFTFFIFCIEWLPTIKNYIVISYTFREFFKVKLS